MSLNRTPVLIIPYVWILHRETVPFCKSPVWGSYREAKVSETKTTLKVIVNF